ncbi:U-box domain-containing protein 19-like [Tasmannia lanceolata]|uniref:U-box domain-containing protein 19-like n=1 Tax=Tasmannia lanceolata TaxID=3420 RepID=UPI0040639A9D
MTQKSDRQILTFPAIRPCEGIAPETLLRALIVLCHTISNYKTKIFATNKRNARETIREIEILLIFLEEINGLILSDSMILCLSELYITLQKIQYLLEDCTHEGARVWILMKSELVMNEFRILIRSVGTALDVIPLGSIDVPVEVREVVELLTKQVWNVKIEIDPGDEQAMKDVLAILGGFENRFVPNPINLRRVLNRLGIQSWKDCSKEIKFLEEEIDGKNSKGEEREIAILSSLIGFMNYCRGMLFDVSDARNNDQSDCRLDGDVLNCLNPEDFKCPISLELMSDPVTVATGQTYDRASIQKWFRAGNLICPKTGEKLMNTELVPNSALHKLIQQFCHDNGATLVESGNRGRDITRTLVPGSSAAAKSMKMLAIFLVDKLAEGREEERNKAAYEIRLLAKSNIYNRVCLVEAGSVMPLLNLVSSSDPSSQENSISALLNLSKHAKGKTVIVESGGLIPILDVLSKGLRMEARQNAAAILFYLSSVHEYREIIGEIPEAIPALVGLIRNGSYRAKKNAVVALFGLLIFPANHHRALSMGVVPSLINLLASEREDLVNDSLAVLATLAENPEGANAILMASAIPVLVAALRSLASRTGREYCVSILMSLCINGGMEVVSILQKMSSLMTSLYSLLTDGTSRGSKKASSLIRLLHGCHNFKPSSMLTSAVQQEHIVRVQ